MSNIFTSVRFSVAKPMVVVAVHLSSHLSYSSVVIRIWVQSFESQRAPTIKFFFLLIFHSCRRILFVQFIFYYLDGLLKRDSMNEIGEIVMQAYIRESYSASDENIDEFSQRGSSTHVQYTSSISTFQENTFQILTFCNSSI